MFRYDHLHNSIIDTRTNNEYMLGPYIHDREIRNSTIADLEMFLDAVETDVPFTGSYRTLIVTTDIIHMGPLGGLVPCIDVKKSDLSSDQKNSLIAAIREMIQNNKTVSPSQRPKVFVHEYYNMVYITACVLVDANPFTTYHALMLSGLDGAITRIVNEDINDLPDYMNHIRSLIVEAFKRVYPDRIQSHHRMNL